MPGKIEIKTNGMVSEVLIDGADISRMCTAAEIKLRGGEPPKISFEFIGPETITYMIEHDSLHSEELIKTSITVLRAELMKHGDLYNGYLASIESVLKPKERYIGDGEFEIHAEHGANYLAEEILKQIIGEE